MLRRCLTVLTGGALVALSAMATPAFASTATPSAAQQPTAAVPTITPATSVNTADPPTGPATMKVTINSINNDCFTPGIVYVVNSTGIHIRQLPNGAVLASISHDQYFDSEIDINGEGPYHCVTSGTVAGQYWVLGYKNADSLDFGYVGLNYLNFVKYVS
jgi:hypothetical protein